MAKKLKMVKCRMCGQSIRSFSPARKWCYECRKVKAIEWARK